MSPLDLGRWWHRNLPPHEEAMLKGGVQVTPHPHLLLLPPGKVGSLAVTTLGLGQPPPSRSASPSSQWPLCWAPILGNDGRSWQRLGDHLVPSSLDRQMEKW